MFFFSVLSMFRCFATLSVKRNVLVSFRGSEHVGMNRARMASCRLSLCFDHSVSERTEKIEI